MAFAGALPNNESTKTTKLVILALILPKGVVVNIVYSHIVQVSTTLGFLGVQLYTSPSRLEWDNLHDRCSTWAVSNPLHPSRRSKCIALLIEIGGEFTLTHTQKDPHAMVIQCSTEKKHRLRPNTF